MLIDSNIIVYALNDASPKQIDAQKFLQEHISDGVMAHQNVLESIRILTHPKFVSPMRINEAIAAVGAIVDTFKIIYPNLETLPLALAYVEKHQLTADGVFDAYLAATAFSNDVTAIATDNVKHFRKFHELTVFNPFFRQ